MWVTSTINGTKQIWYSEEEYEILRQENQEASEIIAELEYKCKHLEKECTEQVKELEVLRNIKEHYGK